MNADIDALNITIVPHEYYDAVYMTKGNECTYLDVLISKAFIALKTNGMLIVKKGIEVDDTLLSSYGFVKDGKNYIKKGTKE